MTGAQLADAAGCVAALAAEAAAVGGPVDVVQGRVAQERCAATLTPPIRERRTRAA
jgi:hypothetical protein